jgi:hypothetical protein
MLNSVMDLDRLYPIEKIYVSATKMKKSVCDEWNDIYAFLALVVVKGDRVVMRYIYRYDKSLVLCHGQSQMGGRSHKLVAIKWSAIK